jgi:biotin carboxylase
MLLLLLPRTTYRAEGFLQAVQPLKIALAIATEHGSDIAVPAGAHRLWLDFQDLDGAVQTILDFAKGHVIEAVLGVDDQTTIVAAAVSAALKLRHNSVEAVSAAGNKYRMRELLRRQGVPVPDFSLFSIHDDPEAAARKVRFPCVLKPLTLSASCGVIRADNTADFVSAFRRIAALLRRIGLAAKNDSGRRLLVEEFIPGQETALEGLLTAGRLRVLALFDKPDPLNGPFFEETIYVTPSRLPMRSQR